MPNTDALTLVVADVKIVDIDGGYTRGWIVPAGTALTDLEKDAIDHIDVPASEDEDEDVWWQNLRDAAANAGWAVEAPITHDGATVITGIVKA
jgi:hypothetical protein